MSDPKDFYFAVKYNNTHERNGVDQFFIVQKDVFDDLKEEIFDTDPDDCESVSFAKEVKLVRNEDMPYLYNKGYRACTQLIYEDLNNLGVEENQDITECFDLWFENKYHSTFHDEESGDE